MVRMDPRGAPEAAGLRGLRAQQGELAPRPRGRPGRQTLRKQTWAFQKLTKAMRGHNVDYVKVTINIQAVVKHMKSCSDFVFVPVSSIFHL